MESIFLLVTIILHCEIISNTIIIYRIILNLEAENKLTARWSIYKWLHVNKCYYLFIHLCFLSFILSRVLVLTYDILSLNLTNDFTHVSLNTSFHMMNITGLFLLSLIIRDRYMHIIHNTK